MDGGGSIRCFVNRIGKAGRKITIRSGETGDSLEKSGELSQQGGCDHASIL